MALGARPGDIVSGVLRQGAQLAIAGVIVGALVAYGLTRLLRAFLFGVSALDPVTFGGWSALLLALAMVASYLPARRATRIDVSAALSGRH
jgi:ABC-type antimicrobial peptide transport system permease subunit